MAPWTSQSSGVRADAQCCKITWLDELVSESNTIQAQEDITQAGLKAGKDQRNYVVKSDGFSLISLDRCIRLGSRTVWYKNVVSCFSGFQRDHLENPCERDLARSECSACMRETLVAPDLAHMDFPDGPAGIH